MLHAWDGIDCLAATATIKHFSPMREDPDWPRFLEPADVERPTRQLAAWWRAPDRWRHDCELYDGRRLSYIGVGERWWLWVNGHLARSGTIAQAVQQRITEEGNLLYGRPYLTPQQNAHLWLWINPIIWVASFSMIVNVGTRNDVYGENVVHVLAGENWVDYPDSPLQHDLSSNWYISRWDRDQELSDYVNLYQLWVDIETGFCRRMTGEGANGRGWDIIVDSLRLNEGASVPDAVFQGPEAAMEP